MRIRGVRRAKQLRNALINRFLGFRDQFYFPFDVSMAMPESADEEFITTIKQLNSNLIEYWVADGTLLGIFRSSSLIPHDTDIDFYLSSDKSLPMIENLLKTRGFRVGRRMSKFSRNYQLTFYNDSKVIIDFCIWHSNGPNSRQWRGPEIRGRRVQPQSFFDGCQYLDYKGVKLRTFKEIDGWLHYVYGSDWRTPESKKGDWREDMHDLE